MDKTVASKVPFHDLCRLCEKICSKDGQQNKEKVLASFIERWRGFHAKLHEGNPKTEDSFYPTLRLLLPKFEKERSAYGIKEVTLARLYIDILVLNKDGEDAQSLLKFRTQQGKVNAGDFASVAFMVLKNRCPDTGQLTINDVNKYLDNVAVSSAARKKDEVKQNLMQLLKNTSALEQKWLIRMIMKDMKMGMSEKSVLNAFHADARDLFDVSNSLFKVCSTLKDSKVRLHEVEISIFSPFRPMLGERSVPEKVEKLMGNKAFFIEIKYDGERMQFHKNGSEYKFFSRSGYDYSHVFGSSYDNGTLAQHIHHLFDSKVTSCILDGEMMGYNTRTDTIGSKGQNFDVKFLQDGQDLRPFYCVFDILLYNGKVLSNLPLSERVSYLKNLFKSVKGRLQLSERKLARSKEEVVEALNEAIDNREEGLVVKSVSSLYKPNTRKGGWLKIKPEYIDGLMDELDLIIIGGYFGEGHRSGMVSHFLLGVAVPNGSDDHPNMFHSFCKVGSGYTLEELHKLGCKLKDHWQVYNKKSPPSSILLASGHKEKPDLFIEPSKSFILQVKAAEIIKSEKFKTECTLRFPRVEMVRYDKPWHQCMTLSELKDLREKSCGKLASKHMLKDDTSDSDVSPKKKQAKVKVQQSIVIAPHFRGADLSTVSKESELFKGFEICVINDSSAMTKQELEKAVARDGGNVVQNPGHGTSFVISSKLDLRTKNLVKHQAYDIVKGEWLLTCIAEKRFIQWLPSDMLHSNPNTLKGFAADFDQFGDTFYEDVDVDNLKKIFDEMKTENLITNREIAELEQKYFPNSSPMGLFRQHSFYLDSPDDGLNTGNFPSWDENKLFQNNLAVCTSRLKLYGGSIKDKLNADTSHVVLNEEYLSHLNDFRAANRKRRKKFHIVTKSWVYDCIEHNYLLSEHKYEPM